MKRKLPHDFSIPIAARSLAEIEQQLALFSDEQLEEMIGHDAIGQKLRAMPQAQLEALASPIVSGLGDVMR